MIQRILALAVLCIGLASPAKSQNILGREGVIAFIPVVQNAAYASGQSLGGLQTISIFQNPQLSFALPNQVSGIFDNFSISSNGGSTTAMTIYIFDVNPTGTTCTDKSAFSLATADISKLAMAPFVLTPAIIGTGTTVTIAQLTQVVSIKNRDAATSNNIYICIVANGSVTPATTSDLVAKISVSLDY
jgi:hypothetical protein